MAAKKARAVRAADDLIERAARSEKRRLEQQIAQLKGQLRQAHAERDAAERAADLVELHKRCARAPVTVRPPARKAGDRTAAAVLLCSDWHVGERVSRRKTGVNEYNPDIARASSRSLFDAYRWLIEHHRNSWAIDTLVLWLGGDLITGYLHDDQRQSNYLSPTQESLLVQDLVGEGLDGILALPNVREILVICSYGNHGRTTPKPQIATGAENSFEWHLYQQLARSYAKHDRLRWVIADGEFTYAKVYGTTLRFTHGDAVKYGGGVGGITVPVNRAIARWQTYQHADVTCMGHWHSYHDLPGLVVNGSLIGAAPYGMRGFAHERPAQAFFLVDSERGKCMSTPVWIKGR